MLSLKGPKVLPLDSTACASALEVSFVRNSELYTMPRRWLTSVTSLHFLNFKTSHEGPCLGCEGGFQAGFLRASVWGRGTAASLLDRVFVGVQPRVLL